MEPIAITRIKPAYYSVYVIINRVNDKRYIGLTCRPKERWQGHKDAHKKRSGKLYAAMRKYGFSSFEFVILHSCLTRQEANTIERGLIKNLDTMGRRGYNATLGGPGAAGHRFSEESKRKMSASLTALFAREGSWNTGRKHSAETKKRFSEMRLGGRRSEETRRKMSESAQKHSATRSVRMTGTHLSEETKQKISTANKGRKATPEAVERIASLHRGKKMDRDLRQKIADGHRRMYAARRVAQGFPRLDVDYIRQRRVEGARQREIAAEFGVTPSHISRILSGEATA